MPAATTAKASSSSLAKAARRSELKAIRTIDKFWGMGKVRGNHHSKDAIQAKTELTRYVDSLLDDIRDPRSLWTMDSAGTVVDASPATAAAAEKRKELKRRIAEWTKHKLAEVVQKREVDKIHKEIDARESVLSFVPTRVKADEEHTLETLWNRMFHVQPGMKKPQKKV